MPLNCAESVHSKPEKCVLSRKGYKKIQQCMLF
jgi:hypothetical protein